MTGLVFIAAVIAILTLPTGAKMIGNPSPDMARAWARVSVWSHVAWAVVCVAMVAGLLAWGLWPR